jgi:hypothetical protein
LRFPPTENGLPHQEAAGTTNKPYFNTTILLQILLEDKSGDKWSRTVDFAGGAGGQRILEQI